MTRIALLFACIVAVGCVHRAPEYRGRPRVASAELVSVNPDVKTVADSDQPLFFARGFFWLFHDGSWWRAERATSDVWVKVEDPPVPVKQILNPYAFTNYRDTDTTRTAVRETPSGATLQRSLVRQSKVAEDEAAAAAKGKEPAPAAQPASPTQRSTDPSDPATTTDSPGL